MRASISRTELFAFVRSLGGNPDDTRRIEIKPGGIEVTTFRRDEQGNKVVAGDDLATDVITIAIVGDDGDSDLVRMRHPNLDAEVDVPATAVGHHAMAGWEVAVPYDKGGQIPTGVSEVTATEREPVIPEQPEPDPEESKTPRRRKSKESE